MSRRANFGGALTDAPPPSSTSSSTPAPPLGLARPPPPHIQQQEARRQVTPIPAAAGGAPKPPGKGKGKAKPPSARPSQQQQQPQRARSASGAALHPSLTSMNAAAKALADAADAAGGEDEGPICFICAEPVQYWAVGVCSHRTCHTCAIRLRALYKKKECTFCKTECPTVIFTEDDEKPFEEYTATDAPFSDPKLGLLFETRAQLDDTLSLLRFNCPYKPSLSTSSSAAPHPVPSPSTPDPALAAAQDAGAATPPPPGGADACPQILTGWTDLKRHVRSAHGTTMCDLCCTNKRIFAHEHELFHLPPSSQNGGGRGGRREASELDAHLEQQHAMCGFCKRWFYDSDELFKHCREQHEECFICVRQGVRHQYHLNYDRLEEHYKSSHYLCPHPSCLAKKFIVFETEIDLQAHALEEHGVGGASGSGGAQDQKARAAARRIDTNFSYSTGETSRGGGGGGGGGRGGRAGGGGGRAPAASFVEPAQERTPLSERRIPGMGPAVGGGGRRAGFGGQLTADPSPSTSGANTPRSGAGAGGATPPSGDTVQRHAELLERVREAVRGNEGKVAGFKIAVRSYRSGEMSAGSLIDQLFHLFDRDLTSSQIIFTSLSDLLDDPAKRSAVLSAWRDLRIEQNQFPSLAPLAPSLAATGAPVATHNTSARALSAQHRAGGNPSSTWARVEQAANAAGPAPVAPRSNPFPALLSASNAKEIPGLSKAGQKTKRGGVSTAWSGASAPSTASTSAFPSLGGGASRAPSAAHTPVSISRPSSVASTPFSAHARGSVRSFQSSAPKGATGLDFPSLATAAGPSSAAFGSNSMLSARERMKAAMLKPVQRTVSDDTVAGPSGSFGGQQLSREDFESSDASSGGGAGGKKGGKKGKGKGKILLMSSGLASQTN